MDLESILDTIKQHGFRVTPQRVQVVNLLFELPHPSADRIYSVIAQQFPYVSPATVYNTLKLLKELGIVNELTYSNRHSHYEVAKKEHWHFNCDVCGGIFDLEATKKSHVPVFPNMSEGFRIERYRIELYGTCPNCEGKKSTMK